MSKRISAVKEDAFQLALGGKSYPCVLSYPAGGEASSLGVILAHGAGGDLSTGHLPTTATRLAETGYPCLRFTCKPVHLATRRKIFLAALEEVMKRRGGRGIKSWAFAGHSMGSRVAATCSQESSHDVKGCIFFSYPLHPPGKPDQLRDTPLCELTLPLMFVRGTKDTGFSQPEKFQCVLKKLKSSNCKVHEVANGDHSLKVTGGAAAKQKAMDEVYAAVLAFMQQLSSLPPPGNKPADGESAHADTDQQATDTTEQEQVAEAEKSPSKAQCKGSKSQKRPVAQQASKRSGKRPKR